MQLIVDKLEKSFGVQEVFKDVSFMIAKGEKIGLVGVNGSGKSTLVKCLLRPDYADRGTVSFEPGINVGYVEQGFGSIKNWQNWNRHRHPVTRKSWTATAALPSAMNSWTVTIMKQN